MASLKQVYQQDTDAEEIKMISDDTLFTVYNPKFIEDKKQMIEDYIETLYERNTPNMVCDPVTQMVYYQSQNLESLVMYIIEEKEKLNAFIRKSNRNLYHLYAVLEDYTKQEQIFIKNYIRNTKVRDNELVRRFKIDLYNYVQVEREKRQEEHNKKSFNAYLVDKDEVRKRQQKTKINNGYGLTLNQEKELRLIKEYEAERNTDMGIFINLIQQMNNDELLSYVLDRHEFNIDSYNLKILTDAALYRLPLKQRKQAYNHLKAITRVLTNNSIEKRLKQYEQ
ncbi:pathogenicity island protein [Staphylococcus hominis]|uniref:pathogenicity island protein n=1 Tax=Staphylococcus hominis TaxID=1290 RepID=UPI001F5715A0|nr:pathogenicity island protein [Staphylococcus hominis]MCI2847628.1 pathogenicity island protein [Staphylococcus hominis]MCI2849721.1 pathogenicity island protein [Staphylococcus hominis]MCI2855872.1 pathogenicity island protein [Staphylococcus hominis]